MKTVHPLTTYRRQRNLTLDDVAHGLGVDKSTVSRWETLVRTPSMAAVRRIVAFTEGDVTADDLLGVVRDPAAQDQEPRENYEDSHTA